MIHIIKDTFLNKNEMKHQALGSSHGLMTLSLTDIKKRNKI